jgi:hypothetical protein
MMRGSGLFFAVGFCGVFACGSSDGTAGSHDAPGGRSSTAGHGGAEAAAAGASTAGGAGSGASGGTASGGTASGGTASGGTASGGTASGGTPGAGAFDAGVAGADFAGAGRAGEASSQAGGGPQAGCGTGAGGATGGPYVDVTSRYSAATSPQRAPILDGSAELHAEHVFNGTLEDIDAPFIRVTDSCGQPPPGYTYTVDVYAVQLVGPGPHRLVVDTCDSELLFSGQVFNPIDTVVMAYQDSNGSNHPLDLDNACPHLLEQADDGCSNYAGPSLLRMSGLHEGTVQIAVTTFGGPPTTPMPYVLHVRSDTSCD